MKEYKFDKIKDLEYGENKQQQAGLYMCNEMADYEVLFNKELTFDNILNLDVITNILSEFYDVNAVAITKHGATCSVALGTNIEDAYNKAFDCDPVSAFYSTIGCTQEVDVETAKHINSMGVKVLIAPDFEYEALNLLQENEALKLVKLNTPLNEIRKICAEDIKVTPFGVLIQEQNNSNLDKDLFKIVTKAKPTTEQIEDAIFAWKVVKHAKTDAAIVAKDFCVRGISQSSANLGLAVENALNQACEYSKDGILATDGVIHSHDVIYACAQGRIGLIIQSGGSSKDHELIELANKYGIAMITTGIKNHKY